MVTEEFKRVRKYVSLLEMDEEKLTEYIKAHRSGP